jgi:hypothetical protein
VALQALTESPVRAPNWSGFAGVAPPQQAVKHSAQRVLLAKQVLYQLSYRPQKPEFTCTNSLDRWCEKRCCCE